MSLKIKWLVSLLFLLPLSLFSQEFKEFELKIPVAVISGIEDTYEIKLGSDYEGELTLLINNHPKTLVFEKGKASFPLIIKEKQELTLEISGFKKEYFINPVPLWLSILPPLIAIVMALIFKEVLSSLLLGIFVGAAILHLSLIHI